MATATLPSARGFFHSCLVWSNAGAGAGRGVKTHVAHAQCEVETPATRAWAPRERETPRTRVAGMARREAVARGHSNQCRKVETMEGGGGHGPARSSAQAPHELSAEWVGPCLRQARVRHTRWARAGGGGASPPGRMPATPALAAPSTCPQTTLAVASYCQFWTANCSPHCQRNCTLQQ